jgi:anti-sigma factor ChrR (cupin superfamily)
LSQSTHEPDGAGAVPVWPLICIAFCQRSDRMYQTKTDTAAVAWSPLDFPGVSMKVLHQDPSTGGMVVMTRIAAGSSIPSHRHTHADETVFVVEGDFIEDGVSYGPGSFFVGKAGSAHGPHRSAGGCVVLTTFSATLDFVPAE